MEDERFAHIVKDPKFRRIAKGQTKVKIDKRFQSMFKDKNFQVKYTVDKRGRPVSHSSKEDLKRYYHLSSDDSEDSDSDDKNDSGNHSEQENEVGKYVKSPKKKSESNDLNLKSKSDKKLPDNVKNKLKNLSVDYARGESTLFSESSSDDEESEEEVSETEDVDHKWGELDADAETTEEVTRRLAACNMDWDRIRAVDLMVLFNSFLPAGGVIESVVIYPSEFGKKRMQEEELKGPTELVSQEPTADDDNEDKEEGSKYHMEKLRQYQLNRLKYYYAVITLDSPETANKIYTECDGREYESSATKIDLRFIPDDTSFDDDEIKEKCEKLPELNKYKPRFFTTTALQQAKVDLTWDETDPNRLEVAEKINSGKLEDITESELQNYLAGSSSEEEGSDKDPRDQEEDSDSDDKDKTDKYKLLLQEIQKNEDAKKNKDVEMEITWGINLKEKTEKIIEQKKSEAEEKTPFQKYLDKRKEKRKAQRNKKKNTEDSDEDDMPSDIDMNDPYFAEEFDNPEFKPLKKKKDKKPRSKEEDSGEENGLEDKELELLLGEDDGKKHFSLKKIQEQEEESTKRGKKKKKKNEDNQEKLDDFKVDVDDNRFSALYTSHHYNIDPTDPHFKKTKAMETLIEEKMKRRNKNEGEDTDSSKTKKFKSNKPNSNTELNMLVKSVKRKADGFKNKNNK